MSVKELKALAKERQVDTSGVVEKAEIVELLVRSAAVASSEGGAKGAAKDAPKSGGRVYSGFRKPDGTSQFVVTDPADSSELMEQCCRVCGNTSKSFCSTCRIARYCSRECQKEDWKSHKDDCTASSLNSGKVIFATAAVDVERVFVGEKVPKSCRFLLGGFMIVGGGAKSNSLSPLGMEIVGQQDVGTLADTAKGLLDALLKGGLTANQVFKYPRSAMESAMAFDIGMPLGIGDAADKWVQEVTKTLRSQPKGASVSSRIQGAMNSMTTAQMQRGMQIYAGGSSARPPGERENAEAAQYDKAFMGGVEKFLPYDVNLVPVGSVITLLHFSNGAFYRRVDVTACRRGLAVDRVMGLSPVPSVINCRALRKFVQAGGAAAARVEPRVGESANVFEVD